MRDNLIWNPDEPPMLLNELSNGACATVERVIAASPEVDAVSLRRLGELGFIPGEPVQLLRRGPGGREPLAVQVGETVFALRLTMILLNIAAALLLWWLLIREAKLSPLLAALAAAPFAMAPFITSAHLVEAQGGNVEPFLWVLVIWVLRDRPPWLGIVLGIAFLNREFTIYAVPALLAVQMMQSRGRVPSLVRPWLITAVCFAIVLVVVSMLKPHADLLGPGTAGIRPGPVFPPGLPRQRRADRGDRFRGARWRWGTGA